MIGISPDTFTLTELYLMWKTHVKNAWGQTSAIMAAVLNTLPGNSVPLDAFVPDLDCDKPSDSPERITDPAVKRAVADQLRKVFK